MSATQDDPKGVLEPPPDQQQPDDAPQSPPDAEWWEGDDDGELDEFADLYVETDEPIELPDLADPQPNHLSKYRPAYDEAARRLCMLGLSSRELARFFGVSRTTLQKWAAAEPTFREAIRQGRHVSDANIAESLYRRAKGYSHRAVKILTSKGEVFREKYIEHYPPDTEAAKFWLKNRRPDLWRDKQETALSGVPGAPVDITDSRANEQRDHILALQDKIREKWSQKKATDGGN